VAHSFPATLDFTCIRDVVSIVRKGDLTADDKIDIGQHVAHFAGSSLEWYRVRRKETPDGVDVSLLDRILSLFGGRSLFGDEPNQAFHTTEDLCSQIENAITPDGANEFGAFPVIQILTIVIPILIELLKRMND
jgi:hypothetical protein